MALPWQYAKLTCAICLGKVDMLTDRKLSPSHAGQVDPSLYKQNIDNVDAHLSVAQDLLVSMMKYRRQTHNEKPCALENCNHCLNQHLPAILAAISCGQALQFVLPAFPAKSPNLNKVLGPLPDKGEQLALTFLNALGQHMEEIYPPGVNIILCSDGRVFSDVIGMKEQDVSDYQQAIDDMIDKFKLRHITTFNLDQCYPGLSYEKMRVKLMQEHAQSLLLLKQKVRAGQQENAAPECQEAHRLYCGMTRFLVEDAMHPSQSKSKTAIQKISRKNAYEVICRSQAWGQLIEQQFPSAMRWSIHPQPCGAKKFGINLMGSDHWMTPWHGVVVDSGGQFRLLKRLEAEALGAQVVYDSNGKPSHYRL